MLDIIFQVNAAGLDEAEGLIKFLKIKLRTDLDVAFSEQRIQLADIFTHEFFSHAGSPYRGGTYDAADRRFTIDKTRREQARVCDHLFTLQRKMMKGAGISVVTILVNALLFDHEHFAAELQDGVEFLRTEVFEFFAGPYGVRHCRFS